MKKGFTLIELLAVIVILAIIALIATPIVLNIINDSRESSTLRSADFYLDAVEYTIADATLNKGGLANGNYPITKEGNLCKGPLDGNGTCTDENTLIVEVNGEKPSSGTITIENGNIKDIEVNLNNKTIVKNEKGELVYKEVELEKTFAEVCGYFYSDVSEKTAGAKYSCEVSPGKFYDFYVLTTPAESDTSINLIMDRNICEDGNVATATNTCLVAWNSSGSNITGPVTAMDYLYKATQNWTNISNIEINYTDEGNETTGEYGYGTIITTDGVTKITKKDGTLVTVLTNQEGYKNLKARMPYLSEVYIGLGSNTRYLYEYLDGSSWSNDSLNLKPTNNISGIYGYWTLSAEQSSSPYASRVDYSGNVYLFGEVGSVSSYGVRPVITLKL